MMQCSICKQFFNPAMLSEVFEHEHKEGLATNKEYFGVKIGEVINGIEYHYDSTGRLKKVVKKIIDKVHHINPNCKDATKCEPHGEVGEVINGN